MASLFMNTVEQLRVLQTSIFSKSVVSRTTKGAPFFSPASSIRA